MDKTLPSVLLTRDTEGFLSSASSNWQPLLVGSLRSQALEAARFVVEHMHNPEYLLQVAHQAEQQTTMPMLGWSPSSMSFGFTGLAFPYVYFSHCFPTEGWDRIARQYLRLAAMGTQTPEGALTTPDFLSGTCGMAIVVYLLSRDGKHYQQTWHNLNAQLYSQVLAHQWESLPVAMHKYDVISGASGILPYLVSLESTDEQHLLSIQRLLDFLIWLAGIDEEHGRPRWYIPNMYLPTEWQREKYPDGYFNCGLSHGIAGPLAALSQTWLAGYRYPNLSTSIASLSDWLLEHAIHDKWGINWPDVVPGARDDGEPGAAYEPARAAWCYGAPGIACALRLAGMALQRPDLCEKATEALEAVLHRPLPMRNIDAPTFCHGVAGLLEICLRFAQDTNSAVIREHIPLLVTQLLGSFDPTSPLGFRDLEGGNIRAEGNVSVDHPGWLNGASGTAMVLLAAATPVAPTWDHFLLIS